MFQIELNFYWKDDESGGDLLLAQPYFMQCHCQECENLDEWRKDIEYFAARFVYDRLNSKIISDAIEAALEAINSGEFNGHGSSNITA